MDTLLVSSKGLFYIYLNINVYKIYFHEQLFMWEEYRAHILAVIIVIIVIEEAVNTVSADFKDKYMSNRSQLQ